MFFNSIKEMNKLRKEINRLLIKGISNIYLTLSWRRPLSYRNQSIDLKSKSGKSMDWFLYDNGLRHKRVTRKLTLSKLRFSKCNKFFTGSVFFRQISLNFQTSCCNLKIRVLGAKLCAAFLLFQFWKELWRFKVKESMHFVEQKHKL